MGNGRGGSKDVRDFIKQLKEFGLQVEPQKGHWKVYTAEGNFVMTFAGSPSDRNWSRAAMRQLDAKLKELYG